MYFEPSYFEGEERQGFYIRPMMKKVWAIQLEVLQKVDTICKRHNIPYWADWGTLLGAVRHKGYIPWDDDIDIGMLRIDYMRFISYAKKELPEDYMIRYPRNSENTNNLVTQILNSKQINTQPAFLERYHGCPYVSGIDIFVYDNIAPDKKEEEIQTGLVTAVYALIECLIRDYNKGKLDVQTQLQYIKKVEDLCGVHFDSNKPLKDQLFLLIDNLSSMYWDTEPKEVCYFFELFYKPHLRFPREWFSSFIEVPFENITIPIPEKYHELLTLLYEDYMTPVRGSAGHDYPSYKKQEKALFAEYEEQGLPIPACFID